MDFEKILPVIIKELEDNKIQYALIGGFAMGVWGISRATTDLDFLIAVEQSDKIERVLGKFWYKCVYKSENISQFVSDLKPFGELDFLHAFREISTAMLKRAAVVEVMNGALKLKVLIPEDIIGLKIQAMVNNPSRRAREMSDIEMLLNYRGDKLDWSLIEKYFLLFSQKEEFEQLKAKYGKNK